MSATMTAPAPSVNGSSAAAAQAVKEQASSLRDRAMGLLTFWRMKAKAALAWAGAKISAVWSAVKAFAVSHSSMISLAAAGAMSVKSVYHGTARLVTTVAKTVANAAITVADKAVYYASKGIGYVVSSIVGLFSKSAATTVASTAGRIAGTATRWANTAKDYVNGSKELADAVLTAPNTTTVVTAGSGITAAAIGINMLTSGSIAGLALELPVVGTTLAAIVAGGPLSLLVIPALIAVGVTLTIATATSGQYSLPKATEPTVIPGVVVEAEQIVEQVVTEAEPVLTYDQAIDAVGLEAYQEQTEAILAEADSFKVLATEITTAKRGKKARR